ncbi:phosphotransferase [Hathewaya proteolytica]|nr:phosphotransferase [Hathewaya proteolytica]
MFKKEEIQELCKIYNVESMEICDVIDTSHGDDDLRFNYKIDQKYVLKINNHKAVTEEFISDMNDVMERYRAIGIYCPSLYKNKHNKYLYSFQKEGTSYVCYLEEYAKYKFYDETVSDFYEFKMEMLHHVGIMASRYSNQYLVPTRTMWTIIELSPFDTDIDEKQENLYELISSLRENSYVELSNKIENLDILHRNNIKKYLEKLPRCVYQGDLNPSNMLVDENNHFKGLVDFNMFGTEVNINCFLNEAMYYLTEEDFEELTAKEIMEKMEQKQKELMAVILKNYELSELEKLIMNDYKWITYASFYPNVQMWIYLIKEHKNEEKVIEMLEILCNLSM